MASLGDFYSGDRSGPVAGIVLVARGNEREEPIDAPQLERLRSLLGCFGAGGCVDLYVALGGRVVAAPDDSSTTFFLPDWYNGLDDTVRAALAWAAELDVSGVLLQTVDSPDIGDVGVTRVLAAAAGRRDLVARAVTHGNWSQPVYVGADLLDSADALLTEAGGPVEYLGAHAGEVVAVECSDLG